LLHLAFGTEHFFFDNIWKYVRIIWYRHPRGFLIIPVAAYSRSAGRSRIRWRGAADHHASQRFDSHGASVSGGMSPLRLLESSLPVYRGDPSHRAWALLALFTGCEAGAATGTGAMARRIFASSSDDLVFVPSSANFTVKGIFTRAHCLENPRIAGKSA